MKKLNDHKSHIHFTYTHRVIHTNQPFFLLLIFRIRIRYDCVTLDETVPGSHVHRKKVSLCQHRCDIVVSVAGAEIMIIGESWRSEGLLTSVR